MPLFYFQIYNGLGFAEDRQGQDLPDEKGARRTAVEGARSLMAEEILGGELNLDSFIRVEDHEHTLMFTLTFAEAVKINSGS